jgi:hypothetical protein
MELMVGRMADQPPCFGANPKGPHHDDAQGLAKCCSVGLP